MYGIPAIVILRDFGGTFLRFDVFAHDWRILRNLADGSETFDMNGDIHNSKVWVPGDDVTIDELKAIEP
jgi:hypothetical protein